MGTLDFHSQSFLKSNFFIFLQKITIEEIERQFEANKFLENNVNALNKRLLFFAEKEKRMPWDKIVVEGPVCELFLYSNSSALNFTINSKLGNLYFG